MERPILNKASREVIAYIEYLENRLDGADKLSKEISLLKAGIADDMQLLRLNEAGDNLEKLKYVCFDKKSPKFNMIRTLMDNLSHFATEEKKLTKAIKASPPKEAEVAVPIIEPEVAPPKENIFELTSRKLINGNAAR